MMYLTSSPLSPTLLNSFFCNLGLPSRTGLLLALESNGKLVPGRCYYLFYENQGLILLICLLTNGSPPEIWGRRTLYLNSRGKWKESQCSFLQQGARRSRKRAAEAEEFNEPRLILSLQFLWVGLVGRAGDRRSRS